MNLESREYFYHLALTEFWPPAEGRPYERSTIDSTLAEEGYVHLCRAGQVKQIADKYYHGRDDVMLLTIDPSLLDSKVEFEESPHHALAFPHLYGPIPPRAVIHTDPLELDEDGLLQLDQLLPV
jgi:uncharacterized protein (DUF952 family)